MCFSRRILFSLIIPFLLLAFSISSSWAKDRSVDASNKITAIVPESFPPYYQLNKKGEIEGFAIDIMNAVSKRAGIEVEYQVKDSWKKVFSAMKAGKADLIPNVGAIKPRQAYLDFTQSVETFHISLFIRAESTSQFIKPDDLSGRKVGAVRSNVGYKVISKIKSMDAIAYESFEQAFYALLGGQIDALAYPESVGWKLIRAVKQERSVTVIDQSLKEIKRVIGVKKGNTQLLSKLNLAIDELVKSEDYATIYQRWFATAPTFWTIDRVLFLIPILLVAVIVFVGWWRFLLLEKHKEELDQQVKQRTEELNDTNKLLQNVLDAIPSRVFWKDLDNIYLGCNTKFAGDAGEETVEAVIGKNDFDFPWKDQAELYRKDDSKVMSSGQGKLNYEEPQTTPDGENIWLETSKIALRKTDGSIYGVLGIYHDITPRKKMEEALKESKEIFAIAETIAHIGSWDWNVEKGKLVWSDELFKIFGVDSRKFKPTVERFIEHVHEDDKQHIIESIDQALENEEIVFDVEHRIVQADGHERFVHNMGYVYRDNSGKSVRMVGAVNDITEQKNAEIKMMTAKDEAEKANKSKSTFLSNMSHELRTPLHGILSYAQLGIKKSVNQGDEKFHKYFFRINSSGERLKVLLNDLLDISKLEAEKMQLDIKQENIVWIIESCIDEQKALAESRRLNINLKVAESVPDVACDKNRIGQVVMNLLGNAIKFSPDEKLISIKVDKTELTYNAKQAEAVKISIADQGKGVAEADREIIFDKFVQSEQRDGFTTGTGLGLAISKELVKLHNGKIWCQQAIGGGAELVVVLPVEYQVINIG